MLEGDSRQALSCEGSIHICALLYQQLQTPLTRSTMCKLHAISAAAYKMHLRMQGVALQGVVQAIRRRQLLVLEQHQKRQPG